MSTIVLYTNLLFTPSSSLEGSFKFYPTPAQSQPPGCLLNAQCLAVPLVQSVKFFNCSNVKKIKIVVGCKRVKAGTQPLNMNIAPSFLREERITARVDYEFKEDVSKWRRILGWDGEWTYIWAGAGSVHDSTLLEWNGLLTLVPYFALRYQILTFSTSAGEQTVVATVPFTIKYQHAFTFPLFQQKRTEEKHTAAKLAVKWTTMLSSKYFVFNNSLLKKSYLFQR